MATLLRRTPAALLPLQATLASAHLPHGESHLHPYGVLGMPVRVRAAGGLTPGIGATRFAPRRSAARRHAAARARREGAAEASRR